MEFWKVSSEIQERAYLIENKSFPTTYSVWCLLTGISGQIYAAEIYGNMQNLISNILG